MQYSGVYIYTEEVFNAYVQVIYTYLTTIVLVETGAATGGAVMPTV